MPVQEAIRREVDQFLQDYIDTVPHLEAFLLLWQSHPHSWSVEEMAEALFLSPDATKGILDGLAVQRLIVNTPGIANPYQYQPDPVRDPLVAALDSIYRRELIRVSTLIHAKPSAAVREFARAFRIKKERE